MTDADSLLGLYVPDRTTVREHDLVTEGDIIVADDTIVELGVQGRTVLVGPATQFDGHIEAKRDCRLDANTTVGDYLLVGRDADLGPGVRIARDLRVGRHLRYDETVTVGGNRRADGSEIAGASLPTVGYFSLYFTYLASGGTLSPPAPLVVPRSSYISDDRWETTTPAWIGNECRIHGNVRAPTVTVGTNTTVFGGFQAQQAVHIGEQTTVHGDIVVENGNVTIEDGAHVRGDIVCHELSVAAMAQVDGTMRASGAVDIESLAGPRRD